MINGRRQILVITLVATALCAPRRDGSGAENARLRSSAVPFARLATRLSVSLRQVVPAMHFHRDIRQDRCDLDQKLPHSYFALLHPTSGVILEYRTPPPLRIIAALS